MARHCDDAALEFFVLVMLNRNRFTDLLSNLSAKAKLHRVNQVRQAHADLFIAITESRAESAHAALDRYLSASA